MWRLPGGRTGGPRRPLVAAVASYSTLWRPLLLAAEDSGKCVPALWPQAPVPGCGHRTRATGVPPLPVLAVTNPSRIQIQRARIP